MSNKPQFSGEKTITTLKEASKLIMGQSPSSDSYNADSNGLPFYQGNADFGEDSPTPRIWCTDPKKIAEKGDILLSVRAPIGAINIAGEQCCIGRGIAAIRPNTELVSRDYLRHQLCASRHKLEAMGTGSTFKAIGKKALGDFAITIYPKKEQEAIACQLNWVAEHIKLANSQLAQLDNLVKSQFVEMFGDPVDGTLWTRRRLSDLYEVKSSKRVYARELTEGGVPFLRLADIGSLIDSGMHTSGLFISEEKYNSLKERGNVPAPGDVLVTARGTLGRCYVIETSDRFYFQDGMITWLAAGEQSPLPRYLLSVFDDHHFIENLNRNCSGTTVKYLSISDLSNVAIPVPPLELQCCFTDFAASVDKSKFIAQQQIEKLQTLYDSLAQEYFS